MKALLIALFLGLLPSVAELGSPAPTPVKITPTEDQGPCPPLSTLFKKIATTTQPPCTYVYMGANTTGTIGGVATNFFTGMNFQVGGITQVCVNVPRTDCAACPPTLCCYDLPCP